MFLEGCAVFHMLAYNCIRVKVPDLSTPFKPHMIHYTDIIINIEFAFCFVIALEYPSHIRVLDVHGTAPCLFSSNRLDSAYRLNIK